MFRNLSLVVVVLFCSFCAFGQASEQSQNVAKLEVKKTVFLGVNFSNQFDATNWQPPAFPNPLSRRAQMNVQSPPRALSRVRRYAFITLISEPKPWRPGQNPYKVKYGNTKVCLVNWCPKFSFLKNQPNIQIAVKGNF